MNESTGTELDRFGVKWQDPRNPICILMPDGYWTPWHVAQERIRKLEAVLQWLLWLHNDDLHGTTPVASEAEWDEAWETASELVEESPR